MTRLRLVPAWAVIVLAASACGGAIPNGSPQLSPPPDRNLITPEELSQRRFSTVYAAIETLRPNWLTLRGPDGEVQVYLDEQHLGNVRTLLTIPVPSVQSIRHLDGIAASARYGRDHEQGAILVFTHH